MDGVIYMYDINNIEYIKISTFNLIKRVIIYVGIREKQVSIDGQFKEVSIDKIAELFNIIRDWNDAYYRYVLDAEMFSVSLIKDNQIVKRYKGIGNYPYNYNEFKKWISEII